MEEGETQQSISEMDDTDNDEEMMESQNPTQSFSGWTDSASTMASIIKANLTKINEHR
ncbi:hypothetical protein DPMN_054244 [Dreissena polymorpha]|uniref:Uncharacterized protein n=1 Tax=Dreissena polymorpha TaxID=45954 RepID=A0A9D4HRG1_DREPO|nr:hypothetical protein DPMN_054244 [Dreissena polymorpha]